MRERHGRGVSEGGRPPLSRGRQPPRGSAGRLSFGPGHRRPKSPRRGSHSSAAPEERMATSRPDSGRLSHPRLGPAAAVSRPGRNSSPPWVGGIPVSLLQGEPRLPTDRRGFRYFRKSRLPHRSLAYQRRTVSWKGHFKTGVNASKGKSHFWPQGCALMIKRVLKGTLDCPSSFKRGLGTCSISRTSYKG